MVDEPGKIVSQEWLLTSRKHSRRASTAKRLCSSRWKWGRTRAGPASCGAGAGMTCGRAKRLDGYSPPSICRSIARLASSEDDELVPLRCPAVALVSNSNASAITAMRRTLGVAGVVRSAAFCRPSNIDQAENLQMDLTVIPMRTT